MKNRMEFLNTRIDNVTMSEAVDEIEHMVADDCVNQYVVTPNVDHIVKLEKDEHLREIYEEAALSTTDGQTLIWISRWLKTPIVERVSGSDLFPEVCERAAQKGWRVFLLGAAEGVAARAAQNLEEKYPGLQIVGVYSPPYGFEYDEEEMEQIFQVVGKARPQILVLGLGTPKAEKFFYDHRDRFHVSVALHVGGSIDFEAGVIPRAPRWMRRTGLEWLYRLMKEPKRLARRYLVEDMAIWGICWKYRKKR
ncbi:MAG: WecB/TagA/CpsF family glycosyltransferase [Lachnospiraceae bacterium]|nr:WecB/TagA/CpsF family glycosyltransferase [Lachnospiraceae bacterium]